MRSFTMALALAFAGAFPLSADPLPQGQFIAAPYLADDTLLPRYIALDVNGTDLDLNFASFIAMDFLACEEEQICEYRLSAATAEAELIEQRVALKDVRIDTEARIDEHRFGLPHDRYTQPLLDVMNGAVFIVTEHGFDLAIGDGNRLSFFRADIDAQIAIMAVPVALSLSIRTAQGCEVRGLAPLFADPDPDPSVALFLDGLRGMALRVEMANAAQNLGPTYDLDADDPLLATYRRLAAAIQLPQIIAFTTDPEAPFEERLAEALAVDFQPSFEPGDAERYGGYLPAVVALYDHWNTNPSINQEALCADPSFGFIAAQGD